MIGPSAGGCRHNDGPRTMSDQPFSETLRIQFVQRYLLSVGVAWLGLLMLALATLPW